MRWGLPGCGEGAGGGGEGGSTVKGTGAELPPPDGPFWTTRYRIPGLAKRSGGMTAVSAVRLTLVVTKTVCPARTCEPIRKLEPTMVTVTGKPLPTALAGSIRSIDGPGFGNGDPPGLGS